MPSVLMLSALLLAQVPQPKVYAMEGGDKLRVRMDLPDAASRLRTAKGLLALLAKPRQ